jgi:hypothetical protein
MEAYVYVTFADPDDFKPGAEKPQNPFGPEGPKRIQESI